MCFVNPGDTSRGYVPALNRLHRKYGKFRAQQLAITAIQALVALYNGRVVSIAVEILERLQHLSGAIGNTIAASLAPVFYDMNDSPGDVHPVRIKGLSPKCHGHVLNKRIICDVNLKMISHSLFV